MKPINEKERTMAFFQFLVLALLILFLWPFLFYFDFNIKKKDIETVRQENKQLKESQHFLDGTSYKIDSIVNVIKTFDAMPITKYDLARDQILSDIKDWKDFKGDTTNLDRMKLSMYNAFYNWAWDKKYVIDGNQKDMDLKALKQQYDQLEKQNTDLTNKLENLQRTSN